MSAPEIYSFRASGGYLDKHPIASERWEAGGWRTSTYGVPGQARSRAVIVKETLPSIYAQLGRYVEAAERLARVSLKVRHVVEWDPEDAELLNEFCAAITPFRDPETAPTEPLTEGSDDE